MPELAQVIGIVAMAANVLSFQFKKKNTVIFCQLIGATLFAVNMFMLGAMMGGLLNVIAFIRALVYINKDKLKIKDGFLCAFFMLLYAVSYVLVFTVFGKEPTPINFILELVPLIGMAVMTVAFSGKSAKVIRVTGFFVTSPCWLIYDIVNFSLGGILCEAFSMVSAAVSYFRNDRKNN